ncbi:MAG: Tyrosine recombinase XerD [Candidatus Methanophagaceae archaeon]|nr:MAG: Tyrosine recombinase XerD [Methanophagales archaeon]
MIFIKKGKGNRQRYIPMNRQVKNDLENYINNARIYLIKSGKENEVRPLTEALFLSQRSKRISGNATILRLKGLNYKSKNQVNNPKLTEIAGRYKAWMK